MRCPTVLVLVALGAVALPESAAAQAPPSGPLDPANCATSGCHADVRRHDVIHGPVSVNACDACHTLVSEAEHTFRPARQGAALCTFCHDMSVPGAAVVHEPLVTGDCTGCHDPHGGPDRSFLQATSVTDLCRQCHDDVIGSKRFAHGPVAAGACAVCHSAHASPHPNLLTSRGPDLCLRCHVTTKHQLDMRVVHQPASEDCQACHDPHAADHPMILRAEPQRLCLSCHESIRHAVETATTQHAAVTTDRQCLNCHDPHASDHPRVLQQTMTGLCYECHDREIKLPDGKTLGNIKQVIATGRSLHGPVAQDNCAACHQIHGGDNFRLLVKEYPPEFYAPFREESYALCFSCHDRQLVQVPQTASLTDFRNGELNLHFLHVNRDKKGRTCRACHETHASNKANHIRESVPFGPGGWELPIRFEKLENGGRCAPGCHVPYAYDRVDPVEYPTRPAPAIWPAAARSDTEPADASGDEP